jgi:hypothetical protein
VPVILANRGPVNSRFDVATELWVAAVIANGGTVSVGRKTLVDNLIRGLKTAALFTKLDNLLLFAAENQPSALTDIIARRLATNVSAVGFAANAGYTGDGTSSYINTNYNLVSNAVNFSLNSAHHSLWMLSATEAAGVNVNFDGVYDGTNLTDMITDVSPGVIGRVNSPSEDIPGNGTDGYRGHWMANRSSATDGQLYFNGVSVGTNNALSAGGVPAFPMFVLARNNFGNPALWTVGPIGCFSAGASFNATEAAVFSGILRAYMAAVGAQ